MYVIRATWICSYFVLQKISHNISHYRPNKIYGLKFVAGTGAVSYYTSLVSSTSWFPLHNTQSSVTQHIIKYCNKLFKTTLEVQNLMQHFRLSKMCNTDQMNNKNCGIGIRLQVICKQSRGTQTALDCACFDHQEINYGHRAFEKY